ncbi:hypothetical protein [Nonomuraea aridisoli]|uniref:hypothetical protein n=1 Tax=Nonomuraea aridisoli TaxID=2070368 RepID=UPI0011B944A6|nr:hypothetical protein [Nonomuraea aridisoli]
MRRSGNAFRTGRPFGPGRSGLRLSGLTGLSRLTGLTGLSGFAGLDELARLSRLAGLSGLAGLARLDGLAGLGGLVGLHRWWCAGHGRGEPGVPAFDIVVIRALRGAGQGAGERRGGREGQQRRQRVSDYFHEASLRADPRNDLG